METAISLLYRGSDWFRRQGQETSIYRQPAAPFVAFSLAPVRLEWPLPLIPDVSSYWQGVRVVFMELGAFQFPGSQSVISNRIAFSLPSGVDDPVFETEWGVLRCLRAQL